MRRNDVVMELVTFGEAMLRLSPRTQSVDVNVGGSELNVAVGAAGLGVTSRWVSRLPDNPFGRLIADGARARGVDLTHVQWSDDGRAGLYVADLSDGTRPGDVWYDRADSAMSRIAPGMIDWPGALSGARWFHTSGITPALSEGAAAATAEALRAAKAAGVTVSYDLNYRPKLWSADRARAVQEPLLSQVDVLIANTQDPHLLFGIGADGGTDDTAAVEIAAALARRFGCAAVALTLRDRSRAGVAVRAAIVYTADKVYRGPSLEVAIVDAIGAGDAFSAGLIYGSLRSGDWEMAVRFGTALSALKHGVAGDFSTATNEDVERLLATHTGAMS